MAIIIRPDDLDPLRKPQRVMQEQIEEITKTLQKHMQTLQSQNKVINDFDITTEHDYINRKTTFKYTITYHDKPIITRKNEEE